MSKMTFNYSPYNDDYDRTKNYHKILFKPEVAVQARELNQIQTYAADQTALFANHMFKNGSIVSNCRNNLKKVDYVTINELESITQYSNVTIIGATSGLKAELIEPVDSTDTDPCTFYVKYLNVAIDGKTTKFIDGEKLDIIDSNGIVLNTKTVRCPSCLGVSDKYKMNPTGFGWFFYIDDGVMYYETLFITVNRQHIIVAKYEPPVSVKVGFDFSQEIINYQEDDSLLDNALGYANITGIGADRYKAELLLSVYSTDNAVGENFVLLMKINERGVVDFQKSNAEYADLNDYLAKRQYETNGDYTIRPYKVSFLNDKKESVTDTNGYSLKGDPNKLLCIVTPSISYVKGYRVETIADTYIAFDKARETNSYNAYVKRFDERSYIKLKVHSNNAYPMGNSTTSVVDREPIYLYDALLTNGLPTGNIIGEAKVSDMTLLSKENDNKHIYKYYVYDINMYAGKTLSMVKSACNANTQFMSEVVEDATSKSFMIYQSSNNALIYQLDKENLKTLRDVNNKNNGSISINLRRKFKSTLDAAGSITFTSLSNEFFDAIDETSVCFVESLGVRETILLDSTNSSSSATSVTLKLGATNSGKVVTLLQTVQRTNQKENKKTLVDTSIEKAHKAVGEKIFLGQCDVYQLKSIKLVRKDPVTHQPTELANVTDLFEFNNGITDWAYNESYITLKSPLPNNDADNVLVVEFMYFAHSGNSGYFTIDSYADVFNAPNTPITYENIKKYQSPTTKATYNLTQSIDFRPVVMGTDQITALLPDNNSSMIFDIEYYLPRTDLLSIDKNGIIYIKKGVASESPRPPKVDDTAMALYEIWLRPYTYTLSDINVKFIENKRYTMRDIGKLEKRISNVEYYVSLNQLEKSAADMAIKDENGLDRFKNGFIADNFQEFQAADLTDAEFKSSLDRKSKELRPSFKTRSTKLSLDNDAHKVSGGTTVKDALRHYFAKGDTLMLPFESEMADEQPYATKSVSITPFLTTQQIGKLTLLPNNDLWGDDTILPQMVHNIDTGTEAIKSIADAAGLLSVDWGSWQDMNTTVLATKTDISESTSTTSIRTNNRRKDTPIAGRPGWHEWDEEHQLVSSNTKVTDTIVTTQTTAERTGTAKTVGSRTTEYGLGEVVRDVRLIPFIRPTTVQFHATGLSPNTQYFTYFDKQPVSQYCRNIGIQITADNAKLVLNQTALGGVLLSDSNGELLGEFVIPEKTFFTGQRMFVVTTNAKYDVEDDADLSWSIASNEYYSGGLDVTKQDVTLNVITPTFGVEQVKETKKKEPITTIKSTVSTTTKVVESKWVHVVDPIAQGFVLDEDQFITGLDLYFQRVDDTSKMMFIQIKTMVNGYPGSTVLAEKQINNPAKVIQTSTDSTVPFRVEFDYPVYIEGGVSYCFVVGGDNPRTRIYVAALGQTVLDIPNKIVEQQPKLQSSFRSQNNETWNAEQLETLKYKIYSAKFDISAPLRLQMTNSNESITLDDVPLETEIGSVKVRVYCKDHGYNVDDVCSITLLSNDFIEIKVDAQNNEYIPPEVGQELITNNAKATVDYIEKIQGTPASFRIKLKNVVGALIGGDNFRCPSLVRTVRDPFLLSAQDSKLPVSITVPEITGQLTSDYQNIFPNNEVNGIPISELNKDHFIKFVDSRDSFIIHVNSLAKFTGRTGGKGAQLSNHVFKYDVFNISGCYLSYGSKGGWYVNALNYGEKNTKFELYDNTYNDTPQEIQLGTDYHLNRPRKIHSLNGESKINGKSLTLIGEFTSDNPKLSPIINTDTFSAITISNRVSNYSSESFDVEPNKKGRYVDETDMGNGSELFKYVTKIVSLATPAEDLIVTFDVYKDLDADFDVYVKRLSQYDTVSIDAKPWEKFEFQKTKNSFDLTDRIEYQLTAKEKVATWVDPLTNEIEPFINFKIKLVGRTINSCKPPLFQNFRAIAVT